jgi:hypothetical protein
MQTEDNNYFGSTIYAYTRANAIEDGLLVDVSATAKEAGFNYPVAMTISVWSDYAEWTEEDSKRQTTQDTKGRLFDIFTMLKVAIRSNKKSQDEVRFKVLVVPRDEESRAQKPRLILLKALLGGGDNGEPVITIMLPDED